MTDGERMVEISQDGKHFCSPLFEGQQCSWSPLGHQNILCTLFQSIHESLMTDGERVFEMSKDGKHIRFPPFESQQFSWPPLDLKTFCGPRRQSLHET